MYRIAVDIVTGFLGSGKTTLLRRLMASPLGARAALIVNEIGAVDVDGRVLSGFDSIERAVELPGGCLCCEIDERRFEAALAELVAVRAPDLVVLETSGAADPGPLLARVRAAGGTVDAVIALVDSAVGRAALRDFAVARRQLAAADFVVLNKCDLVPAQEADALAAELGRLAPRALTYRAVHGAVDLSLLFASGVRAHRAAAASVAGDAQPPPHAEVDRLEARVVRSRGTFSRAALERLLAELPASVYRAKGVLRVDESAWGLLFNFVCGRWDVEWLPLRVEESQAVLIGRDLGRSWEALEARFRGCILADEGVRC